MSEIREPVDGDRNQLLAQALIEDFKSIREDVLARNQHLTSMINFTMALTGGLLAAMSLIMQSGLYFILLLASAMYSGLNLYALGHLYTIHQLGYYEYELRKKMEKLINDSASTDSADYVQVWQWRSFFWRRTRGLGPRQFIHVLRNLGQVLVMPMTSIGPIVLYRHFVFVRPQEPRPELTSFDWVLYDASRILAVVVGVVLFEHLFFHLIPPWASVKEDFDSTPDRAKDSLGEEADRQKTP